MTDREYRIMSLAVRLGLIVGFAVGAAMVLLAQWLAA